jgi:hypothetical protein
VAKGGYGVVGLWDKLNSNREKEDIIDRTIMLPYNGYPTITLIADAHEELQYVVGYAHGVFFPPNMIPECFDF